MSLDGTVIKNLVYEFNNEVVNGRIDKIYQNNNNEILINIRAQGKKYRLFISLSGNPRIHFSALEFDNPQNPPAFCMLLRKHLENGQIISIEQYLMDRIIKININSRDELGLDTCKSIIVELMGKYSNIILIDNNDNRIIDALKRINFNVSSVREILPGLTYNPKDISSGIDPCDDINITDLIIKYPDNVNIKRFLLDSFTGISPQMCEEISYRSGLDLNINIKDLEDNELSIFSKSFDEIFSLIKTNSFSPIKIYKNEIFKDFYSIDLQNLNNNEKEFHGSISEIIEEFYNSKSIRDSISSKSSNLKKIINKDIKKISRKIANQSNELNVALNRDKFKIYADLLSSNFYKINKGDEKVVVENFYDNMKEVEIPLDPTLDGPDNASKYYKKYSKLKNASIYLEEQIDLGKAELNYLNSILLNIDMAESPDDFDEIYEELEKQGYIKKKNRKSKKKKNTEENYLTFETNDGFKIYVGKNNKQNDYLTLKFANKKDLWFHVKDAPGSHVILKDDNRNFTDKALIEAARLAAKYSSISTSSNIPVDYTFKANVKRHPSKKPGLVNYTNYKTINIKKE